MTDKPSTVSDAMIEAGEVEYYFALHNKTDAPVAVRAILEAAMKAKEETAPADPPKCNCGEQSNIDPMHAPWCPLYIDQSPDDYCGINQEDTTPGDEVEIDDMERIARLERQLACGSGTIEGTNVTRVNIDDLRAALSAIRNGNEGVRS